jgi:ABC-type lipoprotein export system ATPase subunit
MLDNSSPPSLDSPQRPKNGKGLTEWSQKKQKIFHAIKDRDRGSRFVCCKWSVGTKGRSGSEELSGEQQRVAVALALSNDPSLILADKPTGNLNSGNTATITELFLSLTEKYGKTVIMASHDPKAVEQCRKVYTMRDGSYL